METVQHRISDATLGWYSALSRGSRMGLVIVAAAVVLLAINLRESTVTESPCSLLGTCQLTQAEIQQIEFVLGSEGFDDYQIRDGCIEVPQKKKPTYLKLLTANNALPARLSKEKPGSSMTSPFQTAAQQKHMVMEQRKREVEQHISRFPFVEQTWIIVDVTRPQNRFRVEKQSVVVSVMPSGNHNLSPEHIATIRRVISGAFNSAEDGDIVVTDLNAERAYSGPMDSSENGDLAASWQMMSSERQSVLEAEISQVLKEYAGVQVDVVYESIRPTEPPDRFAMLPSSQRFAIENSGGQSEASIGANSPAWIKDSPVAQKGEASSATAPLPFAHSPSNSPAPAARVAVSISLTAKSVADHATIRPRDQVAFEKELEVLKSMMIEKVRPLIPADSFVENTKFPIQIEVRDEPTYDSDIFSWPQARQYVRMYWPTMAVMLLGTVGLILAGRSPRPLGIGDDVPSGQPLAHNVADSDVQKKSSTDRKREAEERLSHLIDSDPEAAAQVIKGWIRDAS